MAEINLSNEAGRDASVNLEFVGKPDFVRWLDDQGRQASRVRVLKAPISRNVDSLIEQHGDLDALR